MNQNFQFNWIQLFRIILFVREFITHVQKELCGLHHQSVSGHIMLCPNIAMERLPSAVPLRGGGVIPKVFRVKDQFDSKAFESIIIKPVWCVCVYRFLISKCVYCYLFPIYYKWISAEEINKNLNKIYNSSEKKKISKILNNHESMSFAMFFDRKQFQKVIYCMCFFHPFQILVSLYSKQSTS